MRGGLLGRAMLIGGLGIALTSLGGCCCHKWHCGSPRDVRLGRPVCGVSGCDPCCDPCGYGRRLWVPGNGTPAGPCCPGFVRHLGSWLKHGKYGHHGSCVCCGPTCSASAAYGPVLTYPGDGQVFWPPGAIGPEMIMPPARPEPPDELGPAPRPLPKPMTPPTPPVKP